MKHLKGINQNVWNESSCFTWLRSSLSFDDCHPEGSFVSGHKALQMFEQESSVVPLRLQLRDLLILLKNLLASLVQLFGQCGEFLKKAN